MFSTPQSKAFFSQQIIKGKLISQELALTNGLHERVWEAKSMITSIIKILWQSEYREKEIEEKLKEVANSLSHTANILAQSNEMFTFEVSLRGDIKQLEHSFFKNIMKLYEEKIKDLKHGLLLLENEVQQLEQKGYLPYVQNPAKNEVIHCKSKFYQEYIEKINQLENILELSKKVKLEKVVLAVIDFILNKPQEIEINQAPQNIETKQLQIAQKIALDTENGKQVLDVSEYIDQIPEEKEKVEETKKQPMVTSINNIKSKNQNSNVDVNQLLRILHNWVTIKNLKMKQTNRCLKKRIESLNQGNKILKESIRNHKKVINYQSQQAKVRLGKSEFTREQAVDFLREMNEDLQRRFSRRNIYMIVTSDNILRKSKSCSHLPPNLNHEARDPAHLREMDSNLNDSFLQKCNYLISDRFMADEDENQYVMA